MPQLFQTGVSAVHDANVAAATNARQAMIATDTSQAAMTAADKAFFTAVQTSALANGLPDVAATCVVALQSLWGQGKI